MYAEQLLGLDEGLELVYAFVGETVAGTEGIFTDFQHISY
jgi:hypothetical protein